jgi:RNA polymerase sigma-70 factor (ECF subfamily)
MLKLDDTCIIDRVLAGDREIYRELVLRYQQKVYYSLLRRGVSHEDSLDISQETMITAYTKLKSFNRSSSFYTWLYRIAANKLIDKIRKEKIELVELDETISNSMGYEHVADDVESVEMMSYLSKAISNLPNQQREVISMRLIKNLQFNMIAQTLNISEGGAKANYNKGIKNLRKILG